MKKCTKCGEIKDEKMFYRARKNKFHSWCSKCKILANKKYTDYFKEYEKTRKYKLKNYKEKYGIGGRTIATYGLKIALFIYDRAERKCLECGSEYDLTIHHLDGNGRHNQEKGLPVNNDVENLVVLCRRCHGSIHGKQGGKPSRKE